MCCLWALGDQNRGHADSNTGTGSECLRHLGLRVQALRKGCGIQEVHPQTTAEIPTNQEQKLGNTSIHSKGKWSLWGGCIEKLCFALLNLPLRMLPFCKLLTSYPRLFSLRFCVCFFHCAWKKERPDWLMHINRDAKAWLYPEALLFLCKASEWEWGGGPLEPRGHSSFRDLLNYQHASLWLASPPFLSPGPAWLARDCAASQGYFFTEKCRKIHLLIATWKHLSAFASDSR